MTPLAFFKKYSNITVSGLSVEYSDFVLKSKIGLNRPFNSKRKLR